MCKGSLFVVPLAYVDHGCPGLEAEARQQIFLAVRLESEAGVN